MNGELQIRKSKSEKIKNSVNNYTQLPRRNGMNTALIKSQDRCVSGYTPLQLMFWTFCPHLIFLLNVYFLNYFFYMKLIFETYCSPALSNWLLVVVFCFCIIHQQFFLPKYIVRKKTGHNSKGIHVQDMIIADNYIWSFLKCNTSNTQVYREYFGKKWTVSSLFSVFRSTFIIWCQKFNCLPPFQYNFLKLYKELYRLSCSAPLGSQFQSTSLSLNGENIRAFPLIFDGLCTDTNLFDAKDGCNHSVLHKSVAIREIFWLRK